ncbi:MAG TPA: molecular chaperone DnaJ [Pseudomonas sp.]|uniref:molecular chaperone DnaJ n=1 Tax=Pseudomonas sp. TaxID=306 RepID=UPI002BC25DC1|nr:molecular chaperone DnaJ [Pseudomonas sp.]HSX91209.1 molecular chaperone DnaJ [Pseudomonas sp.]
MERADHLHQCAHCAGTGTCSSGNAGESCAVCVKKNELRKGQYSGLACGTCGGLGKTDTITYRMAHRTQPILAIILVMLSMGLVFIFGMAKSPYFHEIMAFCTTLIGGVIGYYFSSKGTSEIKG